MSKDTASICQHSVDAEVPVTFAWAFMTDVRNWSDPPAEFTLDGPFAAGTRGTTRMPDQPPNAWLIGAVDPGHAYTIEGDSFLENATLIVHWQFDALSEHRSRLTQRMELRGANAARYTENIRAAFEPNFEPGMQRLARLMAERAAQRR
jgi:hypothetical protein